MASEVMPESVKRALREFAKRMASEEDHHIVMRSPCVVFDRGRTFLNGTEYMPVPRCDTCRWWGEKMGDCSYHGMLVDDDFGCVKWEARDDAPAA